MIGTARLADIVKTVILTGRVKEEIPVNIFLVSNPEHGKTTLVTENPTKSVIIATDATGTGLLEICNVHPEISHIIINDMTTIMGHSNRAQTYFYAILNSMVEEGVQATFTPAGMQSFANGRRAVIACITPELSKDKRRWWHKTGLSSRVIPIYYSYNDGLLIKIKNSFFTLATRQTKSQSHFNVPDTPVWVKCDKKWSQPIIEIANSLAEGLEEVGIRKTRQLRTLAMGHALLRSWKNAEVKKDDIEFLYEMSTFISWKTPRIL